MLCRNRNNTWFSARAPENWRAAKSFDIADGRVLQTVRLTTRPVRRRTLGPCCRVIPMREASGRQIEKPTLEQRAGF